MEPEQRKENISSELPAHDNLKREDERDSDEDGKFQHRSRNLAEEVDDNEEREPTRAVTKNSHKQHRFIQKQHDEDEEDEDDQINARQNEDYK